jgi:hypothetical protein
MKNIFYTILLFFVSGQSLIAQQKRIDYKVTNYTVNGKNYDKLALENDIALVFYECAENEFCFANQFREGNSQSYGKVYGFNKKNVDETETKHAYKEMQFTWDFQNSYDNVTGKAKVSITEIYIGSTVKMSAEIVVLETNEILLFDGYLEKE